MGKPLSKLPERWVEGGPENKMTVQIKKDPDGRLWLERRGGRWPENWRAVIDPFTFEPIMVSPETAKELFGDDGMGRTSDRFGQRPPSSPHKGPGPQAWPNGKGKEPMHMIASEASPNHPNWFEKERYTTHAYLRDFKRIPRFVVDTPTFFFDSYGLHTAGWMLHCKQRHYNGKPGKLVIKLIHEDKRIKSTVHIRVSDHRLFSVVETEEDFVRVFQEDFCVETEVIARQVHQPLTAYSVEKLMGELNRRGVEVTADLSAPNLDSFSDEALMLELQKRSEARLEGWRPRRRKPDLTNVINIDDIRQKNPVLDEAKLARILAA